MTGPLLARRSLVSAVLGAAAASLVPRPLHAALGALGRGEQGGLRERSLSFVSTRTGERLEATYRAAGRYRDEELRAIDWILRDHRTDDVALRKRSGCVARRSLHLTGMAIDVRLPGVRLSDLRDAALQAKRGGVGYYPGDRFVHVDTGRVRSW